MSHEPSASKGGPFHWFLGFAIAASLIFVIFLGSGRKSKAGLDGHIEIRKISSKRVMWY